MTEPLAVLLLPRRLEDFELKGHARDLLSIPRVIALEPSGRRVPKFLREMLPVRQTKRLRFPGEPRLVALYHPGQYPLARALCGHYEGAELWYFRPEPGSLSAAGPYSRDELLEAIDHPVALVCPSSGWAAASWVAPGARVSRTASRSSGTRVQMAWPAMEAADQANR